MTARDPIADYLRALDDELSLPRRSRARILAETEDHLRCASADLGDGAAAIERYGSPATVATSFAHARARAANGRLAVGTAAAVLPFVVVFFLATQVPSVRAGAPAAAVANGVAGTLGWLTVQLAGVCFVLAIVRCWRLRCTPVPAAGTLRLAWRTAATATLATALTLVADVAAFTRMPAGQGQHAALIFGLVLAAIAGTAVAATQLILAARSVRSLARHVDEPATQDAFDDLGALANAIGDRIGITTHRVAPLALVRRRPWAFAALSALAIGLAAGANHLIAEGAPPHGAAQALAVLLLIAAIEGTAVLACYAALGRFLGLRRPT